MIGMLDSGLASFILFYITYSICDVLTGATELQTNETRTEIWHAG